MTAGDAFIYHLAEGTSPGLLREYQDLRANDCLRPQLVAVHATALGQGEYADWGPHHGSVVWSPFSNLWLYRDTSDVVSARDRGIRVCIGADWSPSGSKHLLGELKVAHLWNHHPKGLGGAFSDQELCEMVTANPADAVGWSDHVGEVRLVVAPGRRGSGLGRQLARHALVSAVGFVSVLGLVIGVMALLCTFAVIELTVTTAPDDVAVIPTVPPFRAIALARFVAESVALTPTANLSGLFLHPTH